MKLVILVLNYIMVIGIWLLVLEADDRRMATNVITIKLYYSISIGSESTGVCEKHSFRASPWPCNPVAKTAILPRIWRSNGLSSQIHFSPEECFFTDTGTINHMTETNHTYKTNHHVFLQLCKWNLIHKFVIELCKLCNIYNSCELYELM